jgi:L-ascorbate metabolism protein UlaG (beta-lactamase superfamily)
MLKKHGLKPDQAVEYNKGGTVKFDDFSVTLVSANHSSSFKGEHAGEAGGVVVRLSDDMVFYHLGDTNIFADLEFYGEMYAPDVIAVPIGDHYTMGPYEAAMCCTLIDADIAIPIHYGTFPILAGDPEVFKVETESASETKVHILKPGEYL